MKKDYCVMVKFLTDADNAFDAKRKLKELISNLGVKYDIAFVLEPKDNHNDDDRVL